MLRDREQEETAEHRRLREAAKHGIDLSYESALPPPGYKHPGVYLRDADFVSSPPRTALLTLRCEQHQVKLADRRRWQSESYAAGRYTYTSGWRRVDGMQIRPCPNCVEWPEPHCTEDLDEQKEYERQREGAVPAFSLKDKQK
jgi:hypothetical protein